MYRICVRNVVVYRKMTMSNDIIVILAVIVSLVFGFGLAIAGTKAKGGK